MRFHSDHFRTVAGEYVKIAQRMCRGHILPRFNHIVFVGGVQRSGTNMVMELLERSADTKIFHERDLRAFDNFSLRSDEVIRGLALSVLPCVIFKALSESWRISALMSQYRHSSALWIYRHYEPVNASNIAHWPGDKNGLDAIMSTGRETAGWRGMGMTDETLALLGKYYRPELSVASAQALFWYYRNQLLFDQGFDRNPSVLLIRYEQLLANPQEELRRTANFLDIRIPHSAAEHVSASSKSTRLDIEEPIRELCESMVARLDEALLRQRNAEHRARMNRQATHSQIGALLTGGPDSKVSPRSETSRS